jgi:hypothetical protein
VGANSIEHVASSTTGDVECRFYCVTDAKHFIGAVALLNSLVLTGHRHPVVMLDCGLSDGQRSLLESAATIVQKPAGIRAPQLAKWVAPLEVPAEAMVLLDVDIVVVSPLDELIRSTRAGKVVAFAGPKPDRFFKQAWGQALGVEGLEPATYINAGFIALPDDPGTAILEEVRHLESTIDLSNSRGFNHAASEDDPFYLADNDSWNAVFCARARDRLLALERELAPARPFSGLRLMDARTLECRYEDGRSPYLLHHWGGEPWLFRTRPSVYTDLLPRLLTADDLAVRIPSDQIPRWLRGARARAIDRHLYSRAGRARNWMGRHGLAR